MFYNSNIFKFVKASLIGSGGIEVVRGLAMIMEESMLFMKAETGLTPNSESTVEEEGILHLNSIYGRG